MRELPPNSNCRVPSVPLVPPICAPRICEHGKTAFFAFSFAALLRLAGCKPVGPNYQQPPYQAPAAYKETGATTVVVPPPPPVCGAWQPASPSDGMLRGSWWQVYQDPQLNTLEDLVAPKNQTLRAALETYLAARDQVAVARAGFYPTL